jgi:hypothetical protein
LLEKNIVANTRKTTQTQTLKKKKGKKKSIGIDGQ